ncbi:acyl-CoA dehydrogenase-like protein [Polyplosphaeria fusca]|uniref:Acyl-CoA dehydrogenase-like protein n=1 Tax=Polyplosphaeria fusca TaxID=682080 RepID=A0A9P4UZJ5_9PLEO|nr:acyl-CoA dehydrogenase-like protein [Polyplosphaeria fusca]
MDDKFGSSLPWAEPSWYTGIPSPYYDEGHAKFRNFIREWMQKTISNADPPSSESETFLKFAELGLLLPIGAGAKIPAEFARHWKLPGVKAEDWDGFYDLIMWDEMYRDIWALPSGISGVVVGLPPLLRFGNGYIKREIVPEILSGKKRICFAVTEPDTGSDLKNIVTTAEKSADGRHFVVNGEKKWITNGGNADYLTTLVRTGGPGINGLSVLLIPKSSQVRTRPMELSPDGQHFTHFVTFDDALVPAENLIGAEGGGFPIIVDNINHERLLASYQALSLSRTAIRQTVNWVCKREAFGTPLVQQPVIRWKLAQMGRQVESLQAWIEQNLYANKHLGSGANKRLGGTTALLKAQAGMTIKFVGDECQKLFGGLGMTKTGLGRDIESIVRRAPLLIVPGGAEDVLLDFGAREALKQAGVKVIPWSPKL